MNVLRLTSIFPFFLLASARYNESACNNSPTLCDVPYQQVLHLGAHNSPFVRTSYNRYTSAGNQYFNVSIQLSGGVRLLQTQLHPKDNAIHLCHTSCDIFDAGTLTKWLKDIKAWLDGHSSEVVTILLVNDKKIPAEQVADAYEDAAMDKISLRPTGEGWPTLTLREIIDSDRRVITYLSNGADEEKVPYLMPEFSHVFETEFQNTDPANFTCYATRPSEVAGPGRIDSAVQRRMGLMNRFLYSEISGTLELFQTNDTYAEVLNGKEGVGNLKDGIEECYGKWGRGGGYVLLDFVDEGAPERVVDFYNNITNPVNREDFPSNPQKEERERKEAREGGWAAVQRLAGRAKEGMPVALGRWIFAAGDWTGSWNRW